MLDLEETTEDFDLDPADASKFPMTLLLGDGPVVRVLNALAKRPGKTMKMAELVDETDVPESNVQMALDRLDAIGALYNPSVGVYGADMSSDTMESFVEAERETAAVVHEGSYFAELVENELEN